MVVLSIFLLISTISPISANKNNNRNRDDNNKGYKGTTRAPTRTPVRPVALVTPRPTRATTKNPYLPPFNANRPAVPLVTNGPKSKGKGVDANRPNPPKGTIGPNSKAKGVDANRPNPSKGTNGPNSKGKGDNKSR